MKRILTLLALLALAYVPATYLHTDPVTLTSAPAVARPTASPTPSPSPSPTATPTPTPSPSPSPSPTATPTPTGCVLTAPWADPMMRYQDDDDCNGVANICEDTGPGGGYDAVVAAGKGLTGRYCVPVGNTLLHPPFPDCVTDDGYQDYNCDGVADYFRN